VRITNVECIRLTYKYTPEEVWGWPGGTYKGWTTCFVRITDAEGRQGVGELGDGLPAPDLVPAVVEKLKPILVGKDPRQVRLLKDQLYRSAPGWGRRGLGISIISGIESALFDLVGKALGVPAYTLLGGAVRSRLPVYASGGLDTTIERLQQELQGYVARGFRAVKIRVGYGLERDLGVVAAARTAIGPGVRLMLDYGASYLKSPPNVIEVAQLARALEPFAPFWLEEPLHPDDLAGHRRLRERTSIPIAAGENTRTIHEVRQFLDADAVDIIQPDAVYAGGMLEQIEIGLASAERGVMLAPHTWGSAPGLMANLYAAACIANTLIIEYSQALNPLREKLLIRPLQLEDGELVVPDLPGLGIDLSETLIEQYPYDPEGAAILKLEN